MIYALGGNPENRLDPERPLTWNTKNVRELVAEVERLRAALRETKFLAEVALAGPAQKEPRDV